MANLDFVSDLHGNTNRDYLGRVNCADKAECAEIAKRYDREYWDGDRRYGYGGYKYDGRWKPVAERLIAHYGLKAGSRVLDVGCGMAHLLYELSDAAPGLEVVGIDVSQYAVEHAKPEVREKIFRGTACDLPFEDNSFDLVISLATLHNLKIFDLRKAITEIGRVGKKNRYIMVESYRNEREKTNLLYWQLTCQSFYATDEWEWLFRNWGYEGDYGFIFFE